MGNGRKSRSSAPVWEAVVRRAIDVVVAVVVLLLTLPMLLLLALWIRRDSPGPALYRHQRVGLGGKAFTMYKFRSMRLGCDDRDHRALIAAELRGEDTSRGGSTKVSNDTRITRPGRLLRRTSLDELPQLLNVLRGEMSLVGPRPCLDWEADMFPPQYVERFSVRPGLTGLWQVRGRSTVGTLDMLRLDMEYVRNRRLRLDLFILLATVATLLKPNGAR
jgi:lipopolysaccharide/colanic/teichoic acid biosynthesis glycosyltransferase